MFKFDFVRTSEILDRNCLFAFFQFSSLYISFCVALFCLAIDFFFYYDIVHLNIFITSINNQSRLYKMLLLFVV